MKLDPDNVESYARTVAALKAYTSGDARSVALLLGGHDPNVVVGDLLRLCCVLLATGPDDLLERLSEQAQELTMEAAR